VSRGVRLPCSLMDRRNELADRERTGWEAFRVLLEEVPADRREVSGVVPGWSVKDIVWHCAGWARFAGDHLDAMAGGTFTDPFEGVEEAHWDRVSQEMIDESRGMSFEEVLGESEAARARLHGIWASLPEVDERAAHWFSEETFAHYQEHAAEIRSFLGRA
jgi:hypothetical protein